ncbi:hypothetical protein WR25_22275 isoform C [Diploscapter pachys]|nr:hypothetical protein WR25_22275 isoform B [Diploscapter pachys]PAV81455.1 hypothetical protein WR25_22275 isoform C [Diploscapter pachys]
MANYTQTIGWFNCFAVSNCVPTPTTTPGTTTTPNWASCPTDNKRSVTNTTSDEYNLKPTGPLLDCSIEIDGVGGEKVIVAVKSLTFDVTGYLRFYDIPGARYIKNYTTNVNTTQDEIKTDSTQIRKIYATTISVQAALITHTAYLLYLVNLIVYYPLTRFVRLSLNYYVIHCWFVSCATVRIIDGKPWDSWINGKPWDSWIDGKSWNSWIDGKPNNSWINGKSNNSWFNGKPNNSWINGKSYNSWIDGKSYNSWIDGTPYIYWIDCK